MSLHKKVIIHVRCLSVKVPLGNRGSLREINPGEDNKGGTGLRGTHRVGCSVPKARGQTLPIHCEPAVPSSKAETPGVAVGVPDRLVHLDQQMAKLRLVD